MAMQSATFVARSVDDGSIPLGLPQSDREALRDYFRWFGAKIGLRSQHASFEAQCFGLGRQVNDVHERMATLIDEGTIRSASRVTRTLRAMIERAEHLEVTVIYHLHGEPPPHARELPRDFGELGAIVHLTDVVEEERERMALLEGNARDRRIAHAYHEDLVERRAWLQHAFWEAAGEMAALRPQSAKREKLLGAWREVQRRALREYGELEPQVAQHSLSARLSAIASADKEATALGALTARLVYRGKRDPSGRPDPDAHAAWQRARADFVMRAQRESHALRVRSTRAYLRAKERAAL